ncbi:SapC family protein [Ramlibacter albus]|uniref:SapC family protein n=1 Tax=Ramlibacter albus TaxID=2079448 RepID=A0A923MBT0_9BURK|nr:SapC family protein [Ramlibacter albus]MBC5767907.1 SapC family protein [Ramlibacter albus]
MSDTMYYEKPVLLDRDKHRKRRVKQSNSFVFAKKANSLYVAGVEFNEACKEYAIVFTRGGNGKIVPVVMLGLRARENLFVDDEDRWTGKYIPAFVRRYPFVLAELPGQAMGVCIDEAFAGLNDKEGEALFDGKGNNTPFLQNALDFLQQYQREYLRTEVFCQRLEQSGLLMEMNAKADLTDGRSFTVSSLMVVDEKKLIELPDAAALSFFRSGELHLISMHLTSLSNMRVLVDKMAARQTPLQPAPKPKSAKA